VAPPEIRTVEMYRGVVPLIAIQLVGLVLIIVFPELVTLAGSGAKATRGGRDRLVWIGSETSLGPRQPSLDSGPGGISGPGWRTLLCR